MYGAIITKLKTGTIKTVVMYGATRPAPPYVVVRPEADPLGRGRLFRIIAHFSQGQQSWLEDYIRLELPQLLDDFSATTRHGNTNMTINNNEYVDIIVDNDDKTISMEGRYLMPSRFF